MTDPKPAFAYLRVSTPRQLLNEISVEQQEDLVRTAAARLGYAIVQVFVDGKSGRSSKGRSSFQQMMTLVRQARGQIGAVFVWKFDRFARNTVEGLTAASELDEIGLEFISATQPLPPGPSGKMMRTILLAVAENESDNNALQVETVMRANAQAGFWNGARPPLGYRTIVVERRGKKDKKKLEIDGTEAGLVEQIFAPTCMATRAPARWASKLWLAG